MSEHDKTKSESDAEPSKHIFESIPDITGILERFKLPGFDLEGFVQSRKLDIDAVTQATSAAYAGAQTIVDKQAEMLKTVLNEIGDVLRQTPSGPSGAGELLHHQQELASDALSTALKSMKEIAEAARKSQADILEIASSRIKSNVEEIRRITKKTPDEEPVAK